MSVTAWDSVTLTAEVALSAATSTYGLWDAGIWDSSLWGPDVVWTDVSSYVRSFSTECGFSRGVQSWQAGTATVTLNNLDGRFSPANLSGPYVSGGVTQVRPLRPVRIRAAYAGTTYPVYQGYVLDWVDSWTGGGAGRGDAVTTIRCADEFTRLTAVDGMEVTPVGAGELAGARVHRVLDAAGHAGERDIDDGETTLIATDLADNVLQELESIAESEGGAVYVTADGTVKFAGRYALIEESRSYTSQATFADDGSGLPYATAEVAYDSDLITNWAAYTAEGGTTQSVYDSTSRALYGDRRDTKTGLLADSDAQVLALAQWAVQQYKDPELRVTSIAVKPRRDPASLWPQVLGRLIRDQITVVRNPPGGFEITQACHIAGIAHDVPDRNTWVTTYTLWSATIYTAYAASRWDTGLWDSALWFF